MTQKILFVDDDPNILQGYKRALRRDFEIETAEGGEQGLAMVASDGPFAVIVSDMRMPGMDGVQFLSRVKEIAPQSIRMMLTGNADQQTAMEAVNSGNIFRFLTKPCPPDEIAQAFRAGLEQYRLITAEKQLLEETLNNSLQVLVDILAMVNPTAFSRSTRVKKLAREVADLLKVPNAWEVEIAAMLSQIGCITVPEEILQKIKTGELLTEKETRLFHQHPQIGRDLITRIPRMETVAEIVANQNKRVKPQTGTESVRSHETLPFGARILKAVLDYDKLLHASSPPRDAFTELAGRVGWYDPKVLEALKEIVSKTADENVCLQVDVSELKPGMMLVKPLISTRDSLLLSAGQEITLSLILRLTNFAEAGFIQDKIHVSVPAGA